MSYRKKNEQKRVELTKLEGWMNFKKYGYFWLTNLMSIMKARNLKTLSLILFCSFLMTGCGFHSAMVDNINNTTTNVDLSKKNFKVVEKVSGFSTATYVLGFGGIANKSLIENAKAKMLENAGLIGGSRAIINMTTESHVTLVFPIFYQKTITVSAYIVEFTE